MAEYIDKKEAVKIAEFYGLACGSVIGRHSGIADIIAQQIEELPSAADVAHVAHGRWNDNIDGITPYCSVCGRTHGCVRRTPEYCPNCGAKMDWEG